MFMAMSLDSLTRNLVSSGKRLSGFENCSESQCKLLTRKGIYPYEYMTSWDRFDETKLPTTEAFYSSLNMSGISESDYQHAERVWIEFNIKNLGKYHDLYLKTDVVLLENVSSVLSIRLMSVSTRSKRHKPEVNRKEEMAD